MRAQLANLPTAFWVVIGLPALVVTRYVVTAILPIVIHAVVPDAVRTVLRVL